MDKNVGEFVYEVGKFVVSAGSLTLGVFGWYYLLTTWGYDYNMRWYVAVALQIVVIMLLYAIGATDAKADEPIDLENCR